MTQSDLDPTAWLNNTAYATITLALAAANPFDKIYLSEGVFSEDIVLNDDDLTIVGTGKQSCIVGQITLSTGIARCGFRNLIIKPPTTKQGIIANASCDGLSIEDIEIIGITGDSIGIDITDCDDVTVRNVIVRNGTEQLRINYSKVYVENYLGVNGTYGITVNGQSPSKAEVEIRKAVIIGSTYSGILLQRLQDTQMRNVYVTNSQDAAKGGLWINDVGEDIRLECLDSSFINNVGHGILINSTGTLTPHFRNNHIYDNAVDDCNSDADVDMEYNWWGTSSPLAAQFAGTGTIDYTPYLSAPIASISNMTYLSSDSGTTGELYCYEDGYFQTDGTEVAWGDTYAGVVVDSETGVAVDDATVIAYRTVAGVTVPDIHPPGKCYTKIDGSWIMYLDAGTYTFTVHKSGMVTQSFNRTITDS